MQWVSELRQSVNYLQSRDDMAGDEDRVSGHQQRSDLGAALHGARAAPEDRHPALLGGLLVDAAARHADAAGDRRAALRAARDAPVLMMNGRHDAIFPYETSQVPLFIACSERRAPTSSI